MLRIRVYLELETWDLSKGPDSFERRRPGNAQGFLSAAGPEYFVATYAQKNYSVPQAQNPFSAVGPGKFPAPQAQENCMRRSPRKIAPQAHGDLFSAAGAGNFQRRRPGGFSEVQSLAEIEGLPELRDYFQIFVPLIPPT